MDKLTPLLVALPLAGGFLMPLVGRALGSRRATAFGPVLLVAAVLALAIVMLARPGETFTYWMGAWTYPIGINLVADGLSKLLLVVVGVIALAALVFSMDYMARYTSPGLYYGLFLLMVAGMNGVVLAGDLFNLFVFLEVAAIASYALVAFGTEADELEAAFKYLVLGSVASAFILAGIAVVYNVTGHLNWAKVAAAVREAGALSPPLYLAGAFFLMGFALKAAMVPFHAWLPDAHPSAPAPISAMLSGVLIKACGVYVLCRLVFTVFAGDPVFGTVLMVLGTLSMVVGVFMAVGQWDFKRLLAYHSISQMGYVVLAIGVAAALAARGGDAAVVGLALFGGLFHLVNHAVFKSLLFMSSGSVEQATGTRQLKDLGGVSARMPVTGACCRIAALSISGVPPLNGFWSKLVIVLALVLAGYYVLAAATVLVSFMTLLSFAKVQRYVLSGRPSERTAAAREAPAGMCVASVGLAVLCFATALVMLDDVRGVVVGPAVDDLTAWAAPPPPAVEVAEAEVPPEAEAPRTAHAPAAEAVALADPSPPSPAGVDPEEADRP